MNKKLLQHIVFLIVSISFGVIQAQQKILNIANKQFEEKQYINAQETYQKVLGLEYKSPEIFKKLGDSYYFNSELEKAAEWYKEFVDNYPDEITNEYVFRYAQCLRTIGEYSLADQYMDQYYQNSEYDNLKTIPLANSDYLKKIEYQSGRYEIENQTINSPFTDFGSAQYKDLIIFSSSRDTLLLKKRIHKWTDESFLSLYQAKIDPETGNLYEVEPFAPELNTKFHESTPVFNQEGNVIYFTKNKIGSNKNELDILGIYKSVKDEKGKWSVPESLSINEKEYSVGHPSLSPDEKTLYFSSDKPGGYGDSDIYGVTINENGELGLPFNLGPKINSPGKDTFPFVSKDGEFYFTSNGHYGLGGLDVFFVDLTKEAIEVINVGKPINSAKDDFGFFIDSNSRKGYFSSNKEGGKGKDDIYSLFEYNRIKSFDINTILGTILDKDTRAYLEGTTVSIYDDKNRIIDSQIIQDGAEYKFSSEQLKDAYMIKAEKEGYIPYEHFINKTEYTDTYLQVIELEKELSLESNTDYTSSSDLNTSFSESSDSYRFELIADNSHFSENTTEILPSSQSKLEEIATLLKKYPKVIVSIASYLDKYNTQPVLAQDRADKIRAYFLSQGIENNRLKASGVPYGSVKLEERLQLIMVVPMPINFDLDVSDLRQDAEFGLNKVVDLMSIYPTMKMEVHGHTDSRSSYWYNKKLSVQRMRSAVSYMTDEGNINWRRIRGRAYGERRLYNECIDGVPCPEEKHEQNRRCEFIIKE